MNARILKLASVVIVTSLLGGCATTAGPAKWSSPCAEYWKDEALARTHPQFEETLRCSSIGGP
jgi:hypothetical protein